jgi:hypothetical protein
MGILGTIGKGLGFLGKNASNIADLGSVLGGAAQGSAGQRVTENQQGLSMAQLEALLSRDKFSADLAGSNAQFGAGEESLEAMLVEEKDIPWDELAFPSTVYALRCHLSDRETGGLQTHVTTLGRRPATAAGIAPLG